MEEYLEPSKEQYLRSGNKEFSFKNDSKDLYMKGKLDQAYNSERANRKNSSLTKLEMKSKKM